jgi:precorrin-3B synthase
MLTGDGYLLRLHFSCGILASDQARHIARLAQRYGNGLIDLTRRANLQIRGLSEERIPELQAQLVATNLIAEDAPGTDAPNVIASPLAGRSREALIDITPIVRDLETRLATELGARELPAKFCVVIEDGARFSLKDVAADIAFEACERDGKVRFAVLIGGDEVAGFVEADELAATALTLMSAFTALRTKTGVFAPRMCELVREVGLPAITASCPAPGGLSRTLWNARHDVDGRGKPGQDVLGLIADDVLGVGAPFGSFHADQLQLLADLAEHFAESEMRLTPWRAILIPAIAVAHMEHIAAKCERAGLIIDPSDRRRHAAACAGAPACASASVNTREMAAALAPLLKPHETLHVSGCAKSCASSASASVTLVGRDGRFDFVRNGKANDTPALFGLSAEAARAAVERIAAEDLAHV